MEYVEQSTTPNAPPPIKPLHSLLASALDSIKDTLGQILSELSSLRVEQKNLQNEVAELKKMQNTANQIGNVSVENWDRSTVTSGVYSGVSEMDAGSNADETETLAGSEDGEHQEIECQGSDKFEYYKELLNKTSEHICDFSDDLVRKEADEGIISLWITFVQKFRQFLAPEDKESLRNYRISRIITEFLAKQGSGSIEEEYISLLNETLDYCGVIRFRDNDGLYLLRKSMTNCGMNSCANSKLLSYLQLYRTILKHDHLMLKDELDIFRMLLEDPGITEFDIKYQTVGLLCFYLKKEGEHEELPPSRKILIDLIEKEIRRWTFGTDVIFDIECLDEYDRLICFSNVSVCKLYGAWTLVNLATLDPTGFGSKLEKYCIGTDTYSEEFSHSYPDVTKFVKLAFALTRKE